MGLCHIEWGIMLLPPLRGKVGMGVNVCRLFASYFPIGCCLRKRKPRNWRLRILVHDIRSTSVIFSCARFMGTCARFMGTCARFMGIRRLRELFLKGGIYFTGLGSVRV